MEQLENLNVVAQELLVTPAQLKTELPVSDQVRHKVHEAREQVRSILDGRDHRLLIVVGPCSIHDVVAAEDYARRLKALADELAPHLFIVMRAYFEKPRTTVGWKGLVNDPFLNDTFHIEEGIRIARGLLLRIAEIGLPLSTEALDPISPQYLQELIAWSAIGARTTESQTASRNGIGAVVGSRLQERYRRQPRRRDQRVAIGVQAAPVPRHQPIGASVDHSHAWEPRRARGSTRGSQRSELRSRQRLRM
jgi:3-deoxy-7-phosphoheptulonate synthase